MNLLLNKLYSFEYGAKSENKEIMEAIEEVDWIIDKDVTSIFDQVWTGQFEGILSLQG